MEEGFEKTKVFMQMRGILPEGFGREGRPWEIRPF